MSDYKEMYLKLMRTTEDAIRLLQQTQLECEEMYLSIPDREIVEFKLTDRDTKLPHN